MGSPIVYFEIAGPDGAELCSFFEGVFGWEIDGSSAIASRSTGGLRGGIREDPCPYRILHPGPEPPLVTHWTDRWVLDLW